ncbi:hypothetical protein HYV81_02905 [Candidatus Woesearchaeota archaeon]|nr:hypothetical protein [Candidatus Woesearchaeota archaeon]
MVVSNPRGTDISQFKQAYRTRNEGDFPDRLIIVLQKEWDLKYGENPHQHGAVYYPVEIAGKNADTIAKLTDLRSVNSAGYGKGGLSMTNTMDISVAMNTLKYFWNRPAAIIMKHTVVAGFALQTKSQSLAGLYRTARDADFRSNFGGTAAFTRPVDRETAEALFEMRHKNFFIDVLAAPGYEEGVVAYVEKERKAMRIGEFRTLEPLPKFAGDETYGLKSIKEMPGSGRFGIQDLLLTRIKSEADLIFDPLVTDKTGIHVINRDPNPEEIDDLVTSWYLNLAAARSNGVLVVRRGVSSGIGSGDVERVGSVERMIVKGMQKAMDREGIAYDPLKGITGWENLKENPFNRAVCSSDAFFPFEDSVKTLARVGVTAIVQPYGSERDGQSIDAANEHGIAMPATLERIFGHF